MRISAFNNFVNFYDGTKGSRQYHNVTNASKHRLQVVIFRMQISTPEKIRVEPFLSTFFGWKAIIDDES